MNVFSALSIWDSAPILLELAWKSSLILLVAGGLHVIFEKRRPLLVSTIWNACIAALLILPFTTFTPPLRVDYLADAPQAMSWQAPLEVKTIPAVETTPQRQPATPSATEPFVPVSTTIKNSSPAATVIATPSFSFGQLLALAWGFGAVLSGARLLLSQFHLQRLLRRAETIDSPRWTAALKHWQTRLGIRSTVRLYRSTETTVPFACGFWRPAIVLPSGLASKATGKECDVVLLHELTHIARNDTFWQWLLLTLRVVYWWQPLLWLADRQIRSVRERVCDQFCVGTLGDRRQYADTLLQVAENIARPVKLGVGLAMVRVPTIVARLGEISSGAHLTRFRPAAHVSMILFMSVAIGSALLGIGIVDAIADSVTTPGKDLHGDPLLKGTVARLGTIRLRHGSRVRDLQYVNKGRLITTKAGSRFHVWDAKTGELIRSEDLDGLFYLPYADDTLMIAKDKSEPLKPWKFTDPKQFPPQVEKKEEAVGGVDEVAVPQADNPHVRYYEMSPDGQTLATATAGNLKQPRTIQLWRFEPNKKLSELTPLNQGWTSESEVEELIFSDDGRWLVTLAFVTRNDAEDQGDEEIKFARVVVYDTRNETDVTTMVVPNPAKSNIRGFAVAPSGRRFALGTTNRKLRIYDVGRQKPIRELTVPQPNPEREQPVTVLDFSPDGTQIAGSGHSKKIWIWDIESGKLLLEIEGHLSWVEELVYSPDGKTLASGGQDGAVHLWDVATGERINPQAGHEYWVFGASLSTDGRFAATCGGDRTTRIWETESGQLLRTLPVKDGPWPWATSCSFSPDGSQIAVTELQRLALFDLNSGRLLWEVMHADPLHSGKSSTTFSADGQRLAAIAGKNKVAVWKTSDHRRLADFDAIEAAPAEDDKAELGEAAGDNRDKYPCEVQSAALSPDGRFLAIGTRTAMAASAIVDIWEVDTHERVQRLIPEKGGANQIQFSPDGKYLVTVGHSSAHGWVDKNREISSENYEDSLILWDLASGALIRKYGSRQPLSEGTRIAYGVTFSPDGKYLVTAERAGTVLVYKVDTGRQLAELHGHTGQVNDAAISADGRRILSVSSDHTGLVWDLPAILADALKKSDQSPRD